LAASEVTVDAPAEPASPARSDELTPRSRAVLSALIGSEPLSRAELVKATRLSMPTLDRALKELRDAKLAVDLTGGGVSQVGLARSVGLVAAVDVGRAHQRTGIADAHGRLIGKSIDREPQTEPDQMSASLLSGIVEQIIDAIDAANGESPNGTPYTLADVRTVGVGVPFPVSPNGTPVALFVPGLTGLELGPIVSSLLHEKALESGVKLHPEFSVSFAKDADLGALALRRDAKRTRRTGDRSIENESLVFLKASHGIDAGIVCHGQLVTGAHGLAGEVGHMWLPMDEDEDRPFFKRSKLGSPVNRCRRCNRRYCLENVASGQAIVDYLRPKEGPATVAKLVRSVQTEQIERPADREAVMSAGEIVGAVLSDAVRLADPTRIVVGGLLALTGETFMNPLRIAFAEAGLSGIQPKIEAVAPERVELIELEGAVAVALRGLRKMWGASRQSHPREP
jgi:predicted NBD/HSP70 family sugar kinase